MLRRLALTAVAPALLFGLVFTALLSAGAANAAVAGSAATNIAATTSTPSPSNPTGPSTATPTNPAPSSGAATTSNPASSGPANPGTGESDPQEQSRTDVMPWILGALAVLVIIALIIWAVRGRRRSAYEEP